MKSRSWKTFFSSLFVLLLASVSASAALNTSVRAESFADSNEVLSQRALLKTQANYQAGPYTFYVDAFFEADRLHVEESPRRSASRGYLQEAYIDLNLENFYFRLGRQALRWSEMWTLPSLDIWSGRRYNRLFVDPLSEQLTHSSGFSATYAGKNMSVDIVVLPELATSTFPRPLPESNEVDDQELSYGMRWGFEWQGLQWQWIGARRQLENIGGLSLNYAFERWVAKLELGGIDKPTSSLSDASDKRSSEVFVSLGADVFLRDWIFSPQWTSLQTLDRTSDLYGTRDFFYLGLNRNDEKSDLQIQIQIDPQKQDQFGSLYWGFFLKQWWSVGGYVQHYDFAKSGTLLSAVSEAAGRDGLIVGLRTEWTAAIEF